jgi:hypothetical protein
LWRGENQGEDVQNIPILFDSKKKYLEMTAQALFVRSFEKNHLI